MKVTYLNVRTSYGVETVDSVHREEFNSGKEYRKEITRLIGEYHLAGMPVYSSCRCTKDWKNK